MGYSKKREDAHKLAVHLYHTLVKGTDMKVFDSSSLTSVVVTAIREFNCSDIPEKGVVTHDTVKLLELTLLTLLELMEIDVMMVGVK